MKSTALFALAAAALLAGCNNKSASSGPGQLRVAVIPKGTTHIFWKSVEAGAKKAADELGVKMTFVGPQKEDDRSQQIDLVKNQALQNDAIVLAPLDAVALRDVVKEVSAKKPVVIFEIFMDKHPGISVDRLDLAPDAELTRIADGEVPPMRDKFYGWAVVTPEVANRVGRVEATPKPGNDFHADIWLPDDALARLDAIRARIHPQRAADRARDAVVEVEAADPGFERDRGNALVGRRRACPHLRRRDRPLRRRPAQRHHPPTRRGCHPEEFAPRRMLPAHRPAGDV